MKRMKRMVALVTTIIVLAAAAAAVALVSIIKNLPNPESFDARQVAQSTKIYDRTGQVLLYEIYGEEKRTIVPFERIPALVKTATIAIEDSEFYRHAALDWRGIARALLVNLKHGRVVQGGSTISQQLAKNAFLSSERTIVRKIKEFILASRLERRYGKDTILNLYLNQIPYGANAYGVEAAAQTYFKKSVDQLSLAEIAVLVSLPKAPTYYSPYGAHVKELIERKNEVLNKLLAEGAITADEKARAEKEPAQFAPPLQSIKAPHFVLTVQDYLNSRYGEDVIRTAGLRVLTTLDWPLQQTAERIVTEGARRNSELYHGTNAALVAQDAATGQVLALVGSADYFNTDNEGNFNVATQGLRQPGSAIKPFAYVTAFAKGYTPDTAVFDLETEFDTTRDPEKSYKPHNFDDQFRGPVTFRQGLAQSINVPSVKVLYLAGLDDTLKTARNFGISTLTERSRYGLSLALGGGEVKLIDLVGAYSVFSQDGVKHNQTLILKIEDKKGSVLEEYRDRATPVIDPQYPRLINDILSDREARSPLFQNSFNLTIFPNQDVALKTGTSNDYRDAWAIGYTPAFVVGVWAGNNDNQPMQRKGGSILAAVPIWHDFMAEALKNQPTVTFTHPEPIVINKPILNGQYLANGQAHDILYFIDRNHPQGPAPENPAADSQFANWEQPVALWAQQNPDKLRTDTAGGPLRIVITAPENGSFVSPPLTVNAVLTSDSDIISLETRLNNSIVDTKTGNWEKSFSYQTTITNTLDLQNKLSLSARNANNQISTAEIILYKKN